MARPRRYEASATAQLAVRLTPQQHRDLKAVAQANRSTVVDVVRDAVNEFVDDYRDGPPVFPRRRRSVRNPSPGGYRGRRT